MAPTPPRHAWDWFARQRLLWRHVRRDLAAAADPVGTRYRLVDARDDVVARLRQDYPTDDVVAATVHRRVDVDIFLGNADRGLDALGIRNAPRGLRWWWSAVTGQPDATDTPAARTDRQLALDVDRTDAVAAHEPGQPGLDEVRYGWGDR